MIHADGTNAPANKIANENFTEQYIWDAMKAVAPAVIPLGIQAQQSAFSGQVNAQINSGLIADISYGIACAMWNRLCRGGKPSVEGGLSKSEANQIVNDFLGAK